MYEGNLVDLQMERVISADAIFDDATYHCKVFRYDSEEDYIYIQLKDNTLTVLSLDAKYRCYISTKKECLYCTGVIKERFQCEAGDMVMFKIENGFYNVSEAKDPIKKN